MIIDMLTSAMSYLALVAAIATMALCGLEMLEWDYKTGDNNGYMLFAILMMLLAIFMKM